MHLEEILAKLVAFPTVVGTPNGDMVDWIREYCQAAGAEVSVHPGPDGDRSNLFATEDLGARLATSANATSI